MNEFKIEGKFLRIDVRETKGKEYKTLILDVEDGNRPQVVPIRLWGRTVDESREWRPGDVLLVKGKLGGRSWQDKVFGDNSAETVEVVGEAQREPKEPDGNGAPENLSDLPF
jgi:single-stranded DNA-binding protein